MDDALDGWAIVLGLGWAFAVLLGAWWAWDITASQPATVRLLAAILMAIVASIAAATVARWVSA